MMKRLFTVAVSLVSIVALAGCNEPPGPPGRDGGRRDAARPDTGTGFDAGPDAAVPPDAGPDAIALVDGGGTDSGVAPDAGFDAGFDAGPFDGGPVPDSGIDMCDFVAPGTPCPCASGSVCLNNGCGDMRCFPAGNVCVTDPDCPAGSNCVGSVCVRAGGGCGDSRDCPAGFSCDASVCVDRRIACSEGAPCPHGFICDLSLSVGAPYCIRANRHCVADTGCPMFGMCADVIGDGSMICRWSTGPNCRTNADCTVSGEVCGTDALDIQSTCQTYGPCASSADCASGFECIDLWADGVNECVPTSGSCTAGTCPAGAICASPYAGGAPRCISSPAL